MSPTARAYSTKFATNESTVTKVSKSIDNIVKTVNLSSISQQSINFTRTIPFDMHHGLIGGTPPYTTKVSRTLTTWVNSPENPKAIFRSGAITANGTSIDRPVVVKLEAALRA